MDLMGLAGPYYHSGVLYSWPVISRLRFQVGLERGTLTV